MLRRRAADSTFQALVLILLSAAAGAGQPTTSASGQVVDETGRPVQGAYATLVSVRGGLWPNPFLWRPATYQAVSGPDGWFRILDVPADSWFLLKIAQKGFTVLVESGIVTPPDGGRVALGTVRLSQGPTVAGRVVDSKGRPLAGARIWALSRDDQQSGELAPISGGPAAVTGSDGRFEIRRFNPGTLEVCWQDLSPARLTPQSSGLNRIVLMPPPLSSRISGRVIDDGGLPVPRAKVHLKSADLWKILEPASMCHLGSPRRPADELVTLSDRKGRFMFELTGSETMNIRAEAAGYLRQENSKVAYSPQNPGKVELVLERGATVSGRVLTAGGLPAADAEVSIAGGRNFDTEPARTDREGRYRVAGVESGDRTMEVRHPSGQARRKLAVAPGENRRPDLILDDDEIREIRGRVTGPDTSSEIGPIPDVSVWISDPAALKAATEGTSTAADGSFRLSLRRGLSESESLGVVADKPGYQKGLLRLDPAAAFSAPLEIRLEPGLRITGHILNLDAERMTEVSVRAQQDETLFTSPVSRDGEYRLAGLGPGDWIVTAELDDNCAAARVALEPGMDETVLDITIPARVEVQGTVLAPDGTPVHGAAVTLHNIDKEALTCGEPFAPTARSSPEGTFWIEAPEGRYAVLADAEGYAPLVQEEPLTVAARPVEGLEIRLESGRSLSGRLLGLHPGEAASASVSATAGSLSRHGQVFADGTYRFDDLGPGDWSVGAIVSLSGSRVERQGRVKLEPGQAAATLDLEILGELSFSVRFASGDEPVLLKMSLARPDAEGESIETATVVLNNEDFHRFSRLPAGRYRLRIEDDGHHRDLERTIDLSSDRELTIDLLNPENP
jgi:protocatechuate 3,4-dioxygenase beta subunit